MLECIVFIPALLGSTVTEISLYLQNAPRDELLGLLSSVARLCPQLHSFAIGILDSDILTFQFVFALERLVCALHHLRSFAAFTSVPTTFGMIHHLGALPGLLHCGGIKIPPNLTNLQHRELFRSDSWGFPRLSSFNFEAPTLELAADVTESLQHSALQNLGVTVDMGIPSMQSLSSFVRLMRSFPHHLCTSSLTCLELSGHNIWFEGAPLSSSICDAFKPLFSLKKLQKLNIDFPFASELDDEWFADAAIAWPHLEMFFLSHDGFPKVTLAGLIPLIRHCHELCDLTLSFSAEPFNMKLLQGASNTEIRRLNGGRCPIVFPVGIFRCLVVMFPNLAVVECRGFESEEEHGAWEKVRDLLARSNCVTTW